MRRRGKDQDEQYEDGSSGCRCGGADLTVFGGNHCFKDITMTTKRMLQGAIIAAIYAVLTILLALSAMDPCRCGYRRH